VKTVDNCQERTSLGCEEWIRQNSTENSKF